MKPPRLALVIVLSLVGGGSLHAQPAPGSSLADLVYTTLPQPCRIIDTRVGGGRLTAARNFKVAGSTQFAEQGGSATGCGVPAGSAVAAMINFVAVDPSGPGNLRGSAWPNAVPAVGSIINYQALIPTLNIANGVIFPICDAAAANCASGFDITLQPNGAAIDLVADVLGFYAKSTTPASLRAEVSSAIASPLVIPATQRELIYTTLAQPCRIIDTRLGGGSLSAGTARSFKVTGSGSFASQGGSAAGCGIPAGATVAMINFVAVDAQGAGNLKASAFPYAIPATGNVINYQLLSPALNVANGLLFPICDPSTATCSADITLEPNGSGVHLVADVLGYFVSAAQSSASVPVTQRDLTYTTFQQPCRIIDTRALGAGGPLAPGVARNFKVAGTTSFDTQGGTAGGCGVPSGAAVAMINFVAVNAQGPGNLKGSAFPNAIPTNGNVINYQLLNPGLNIANGLLFPICDSNQTTCTSDITLQANTSTVSVVADVMGYAKSALPDPTAIYVSASDPAALDDSGCGLGPVGTGVGNHPCRTITYGISRAVAVSRTRVDVAEASYSELVTLHDGVSLFGAYDVSTWRRDATNHVTTLAGGTTGVIGNNVHNLTVAGFTITTADATSTGTSSVGIELVNATNVQVSGNIIHAGKGANGSAGGDGLNPVSAATSGNAGQQGCNGCSGLGAGGPQTMGLEFGGRGGNGGYGTGSGQAGSVGSGNAPVGPGGAGDGSHTCAFGCGNGGAPGLVGGDGPNGETGLPGSGGSSIGQLAGTEYQGANGASGSAGTNGKGGSGGGGGGGSDCCADDRGGGGGSGGEGGLGGNAGAFGAGGGASVAVLLIASTNISLHDNSLSTSNGGDGGHGGNGAIGQQGGARGSQGAAADDGDHGGNGGLGGNGGTGGAAGGGGGGPSAGILLSSSSTMTQTTNTFTIGTGGTGGAGGTNPSAVQGGTGQNGMSAPVITVP